MSTSIGARLQVVHERMADMPLPEWLEGAACGPAAKHLAHLAIHTADAGGSEDDWRGWVRDNVPGVSPALLADAEECMRGAGLWPWQHGGASSRAEVGGENPPVELLDDVGGDAACWAHRVCPECGRLNAAERPQTCEACGADFAA